MALGCHEARERNGDIKFRWTTLLLIITCLAIPSAASAKPLHPLVKAELAKRPVVKRLALSECRSARLGLVFYKLRYSSWLELKGVKNEPDLSFPQGCAHTVWAAKLWRSRAADAKESYHRWLNSQYVLHDYQVTDGNNAWLRAVDEAQKPYPGTASWLLSCSAHEGGHGRWVTYGGGSDYQWAMDNYVVGGWMQFKYPTFAGMFRRARDDVRSRGYQLPEGLDGPQAWLSPLAQALAAGWARYTGNDDQHWSASWNSGC